MGDSPACGAIDHPVALVTGGNRGIGLEVVKSILEEGPNFFVFMGCRNLEAGQALASTLCDTYGKRVEAVQLDVTSAESILSAARNVSAGGRQLDILVNNAGILLEKDDAEFNLEDIRQTMHTNFEAVMNSTAVFLPLIKHGGQIVSTSSGIGPRTLARLTAAHRDALLDVNLDVSTLHSILVQIEHGLRDPSNSYRDIPQIGYGLSKLGVNCLTQVLARLHPNLYINACSPGFCNTDMCANYKGERKPKEPALGASVFRKVLFGELGRGQTGLFFKEGSKADTPLDKAVASVDPWVAGLGG
mmetsp:Transcript_47575/g.85937  ORF Transcript_47575/g.85937 Transcript_47575/m.85937 type:complete len:302 (-) Transcript_47575:202-1107(-)